MTQKEIKKQIRVWSKKYLAEIGISIKHPEVGDYLDELEEVFSKALSQAKAKERERQYELLMSCLPEDAENLSTLTDNQAKRLIDCFLKKSPWD